MTKNGKRMTKPQAKRTLASFVARVALGGLRNSETKEILTLENMGSDRLEKFQAEMNEYGFTRRSIHDTTTCLMYNYTEEQLKSIHDFCYGKLKDGKK